MRRTEVTGCADGVKATGSVEIYDSWLHGNATNTVRSSGASTQKLVFQRNAAYQDACTGNRHFRLASTQPQAAPIIDLRIQDNFFYGSGFITIDRTTTVASGTISGNTFAGTAARGPFTDPTYAGAGARRASNVYESGEPANDNLAAGYACATL